MKVNVSAVLITLNEEKNIERCLRSLSWTREVVVVDSGSIDRTVELCESFGARIFSQEFKDYSSQKNFAIAQARNSWILLLDADEEVTPELREEIVGVLKSAPKDAYKIRRRSRIFGRWFKWTGTQDDRPIRLFRAGRAQFVQPIHEYAKIQGETGLLRSVINHYTYNSIKDYVLRLNRYTSAEAAFLQAKRASIRPSWLTLRPIAVFFRLYFFKLGILDGIEGFLFSAFSAYYAHIKYAKALEFELSK